MKNKGKIVVVLTAILAFAMVLAGCGKGNGGEYTLTNESGFDVKAAVVKAEDENEFGVNLLKDVVKDKAEMEIKVEDASKPVDLQIIFKDGETATFEKVDFKDMEDAKVVGKDDSMVLTFKSKKEGKEQEIVAKDFKSAAKKAEAEKEAQKAEKAKAEAESKDKKEKDASEASNQANQSQSANGASQGSSQEASSQDSQSQQAPAQDNSQSDSNTEGCLVGDALLN